MNLARYILPSVLPFMCAAQDAPPYPRDYFRNPLEIPILLAGNFGECRAGHFHSGLDIKTQGKENLPVFAAAEGYISRIKTEKGGFGHAIYITHPNGYTTLYAHLNKFIPFLQTYLHKEQYERKRWDLDLQLTPAQFPVKRGQQIAWSGNTGGSTAPHLHFEIRDSETEHPLNPQLFGLRVTDDIAPVIKEVAFYDRSVYEGKPVIVPITKRGGTYKPVKQERARYTLNGDTLGIPCGLIGVGINVDDFMDGSDNTITFYTAKVFVDGELQSQVTLDDIGYDESRYIHAYTDYKSRQQSKRWVQCMFRLPGNNLRRIYTRLNANDGRIDFGSGNAQHELRIDITDNNGNKSTFSTWVKAQIQPGEAQAASPETGCKPYRQGKINEYSDPNLSFTLDERQLYDDICLDLSVTPDEKALSDRFRIHYPYIPLHHYFDLQVKPNTTIPFDLRSKVVLMYSDGEDTDGKAATSIEKGWYKASVRNFGTYWLSIDTTAPVIQPLQKNKANLAKAKQISFSVKDATTSVRSFIGKVDGRWVCFEQHGNLFFYEFDEQCPRGRHELVFRAMDENGNEAKYEMDFTR